MNIKRDKTYQARMDGLKYALEIVERGGIEELKKEIRVRNAHFIPLEVSAKKANEISQVLANRILATFTPTVMFSLNQEVPLWKGQAAEVERCFYQSVQHDGCNRSVWLPV